MFSPFICWFVFFVMSLVIPEAAFAQLKGKFSSLIIARKHNRFTERRRLYDAENVCYNRFLLYAIKKPER